MSKNCPINSLLDSVISVFTRKYDEEVDLTYRTNPQKVSDAGVAHLKDFEKLVLHAYDDFDPRSRPVKPGDRIRGTLTIGYGDTKQVRPGMVITEQEAEDRLRHDLEYFARGVYRELDVAVTQNQFDALVSFAFNTGLAAFTKSTLLKKLNAGDDHGASKEFGRWVFSKGRLLAGLVRRREAEKELFLNHLETGE